MKNELKKDIQRIKKIDPLIYVIPTRIQLLPLKRSTEQM